LYEIKLISVKTGEILFISEFKSIAGRGCSEEEISDDMQAAMYWLKTFLKEYKIQLKSLYNIKIK